MQIAICTSPFLACSETLSLSVDQNRSRNVQQVACRRRHPGEENLKGLEGMSSSFQDEGCSLPIESPLCPLPPARRDSRGKNHLSGVQVKQARQDLDPRCTSACTTASYSGTMVHSGCHGLLGTASNGADSIVCADPALRLTC